MGEPTAVGARADYGLDAPGVVRNLFVAGAIGLLLAGTAFIGLWEGVLFHIDLKWSGLAWGTGCTAMGLYMIWSSKVGKVRERERLLDLISWKGDEAVLDVGCGRGLMLIGTARRLTTGRATGIDIWQTEDLTGNRPEATLENARREQVADRVEVRTADMRHIPFADGAFDVIVSNVAIHNIYDRPGREKAVSEIARVLKPGGRLLIADIRHYREYAGTLAQHGVSDIQRTDSRILSLVLTVCSTGSLRPFTLLASPEGGLSWRTEKVSARPGPAVVMDP
jgi:arsenite methyltransferase